MKKLTLTLTAAVLASLLATGCAPLLIGGAMVGGVSVATDRRTSATQLEDETIEIKAGARIREQLGDRVHINVNSYNRVALITGEGPQRGRPGRAGAHRGRRRERHPGDE